MTAPADPPRSSAGSHDRPRIGLRARIWIGALAGTIAALAGGAWIVWFSGTPLEIGGSQDLPMRLLMAGAASVVVAIAMAIWLDRGIVARVRRMSRSARTHDAAPLHEPTASTGWGELADLRNHLSGLIMAYRHATRSEDQLQTLDRQLEGVRETVRHWIETERWAALPSGSGSLSKLAEALNRGMSRQADVQEQNLEAARQVNTDLSVAMADAREAAEQAEGGFVEATALLTTVRELERLGADLHQTLLARPASASAASRTPLTEVLSEATGMMTPLSRGADVLQEISDQVHVLGNRATLIALHAVMATRGHDPDAVAVSPEDLKGLAREAREATDRVHSLARELGGQIRSAVERIALLQQRARDPQPAAPDADSRSAADLVRAIERVREMVQDAARKSERLSATGERASRAADRLVRRLDEEMRDIEGLVVRLSPPSEFRGAAAAISENPPRTAERPLGLVDLGRSPDVLEQHPERREERP